MFPSHDRMACRSVKDWELSWDIGWYSRRWLQTQVELGGNWYENDWPVHYDWPENIQAHAEDCMARDDLDEIYRMIVAIGLGGGDGQVTRRGAQGIREVLIAEATKRKPELRFPISMCKSPQNDEFSALFAIISGIWTDEAIEYRKPGEFKKIDLPQMEDYVFDCHT